MAPYRGSLHRRARADSGAARLCAWARRRRRSWTADDGAHAAGLTPRRARAIVAALSRARLLDQTRAPERLANGQWEPARYVVSAPSRQTRHAPVLVVDGARGQIVGVRASGDGAGNARLRSLIDDAQLSLTAVATALRLRPRTLRRLRDGAAPISRDDPVVAALARGASARLV